MASARPPRKKRAEKFDKKSIARLVIIAALAAAGVPVGTLLMGDQAIDHVMSKPLWVLGGESDKH